MRTTRVDRSGSETEVWLDSEWAFVFFFQQRGRVRVESKKIWARNMLFQTFRLGLAVTQSKHLLRYSLIRLK